MLGVRPCEVPVPSALSRYQGEAGFADCYAIEVPGAITQAAFVEAFYTTPLFKLERTLIRCLAARPANDADARELAAGRSDAFSAWRVEVRSPSELLLADFTGRTRSWLKAVPADWGRAPDRTVLYFGSAVTVRRRADGSSAGMGWGFHALLGFHRLYSRALLRAASWRVRRV